MAVPHDARRPHRFASAPPREDACGLFDVCDRGHFLPDLAADALVRVCGFFREGCMNAVVPLDHRADLTLRDLTTVLVALGGTGTLAQVVAGRAATAIAKAEG
jgi:hypothetical protein